MPESPDSGRTSDLAAPALRDLQERMLDALLAGAAGDAGQPVIAGIVDGGLAPARRLAIYANTVAAHFLESLRSSFPVVRRLVGDPYFAQCVREYHRTRPSRSGDLQHTGSAFATYWLERHGTDRYRYLADVARFEWLIQQSLLAAEEPPFDFARLGQVSPSDYDGLRFRLHAAARLFAAPFPVEAIWSANAVEDADPPCIDLDSGGDRLIVVRGATGVEFVPLSSGEWEFAAALERGATLADAVASAAVASAAGTGGAADATGNVPAFDAAAALQKLVLRGAIVDFAVPPKGYSEREHP